MAFHEVQGWPKEGYSLDGAYHTRKVRCPWGERLATAIALDGVAYPYDNSGAIPDVINIDPEKNSKSSDASNGMISYDNAIVTAKYTTDIKLCGADLITEHLKIETTGKQWTHEGFYWSDDGSNPLRENEGPQRLHAKSTYTLQYHRLAAVPDMVYTHPGYINSNTIFTKILGHYFLSYFLLYRGAVVTRQLTAAGITMFNVKHVFSYAYKPNADGVGLGWNAVWRPDIQAYAPIYDEDGNQMYPYPWRAF